MGNRFLEGGYNHLKEFDTLSQEPFPDILRGKGLFFHLVGVSLNRFET